MIEYLVIMKQNGTLLYSKAFLKLEIEEEVLLGFIAATANFSKEALQSMVEDVNLGRGRRMVLVSASQEKIIAAAITSLDENQELVRSILDQILLNFIGKAGPHYQSINITAMDNEIQQTIKKNSIRISFKRVIGSWILQDIIGFLIYIYALLFLVATPIAMFLSAYIVGTKRWSWINLILYNLWILGIIFSSIISEIVIIGVLVNFILSFMFAWLGNFYCNKKKLKTSSP